MDTSGYSEDTSLLLRALGNARLHFYETSTEFELAPYGHIETRSNNPFELAAYHEMLREHVSNLANEVNAFGHRIGQLESWAKVLPEYCVQDQLALAIELVNSIALSALQAPYALRFRAIFAASHLSHQANMAVDLAWKESNLPDDKKINFLIMRKCVERWEASSELIDALTELSDQSFSDATSDFRSRYNHRRPPELVHGISGLVNRSHDRASDKTIYAFGAQPPLQLDVLVSSLADQHSSALRAFHALSALIKEQLAAVYAI